MPIKSATQYDVPKFSTPGLPVEVHEDYMNPGRPAVYTNWHTAFELLLCEKGSGQLLLGASKYAFGEGDCVIIPPNLLHSLSSEDACEYWCIKVEPIILENAGLPADKQAQIVVNDTSLREFYCNILQETNVPTALSKPRIIANLLLIFALLLEKYPRSDAPEGEEVDAGVRGNIARALEYIQNNLSRRLTLDEVSRAANMSKYYFCRCFTRYMQYTPIRYINLAKCVYARDLLAGGKSVNETAALLGIDNIPYFSRMYKEIMGSNPSEEGKKG